MTLTVQRRRDGDTVQINFTLPSGVIPDARPEQIGEHVKTLIAQGVWHDGEIVHVHDPSHL